MVYWSFTLRDVNVGNFSLLHGPTKDLEDNATAKDFFNQFIYDDYLKAAASKLHFSVAQGVEKTIRELKQQTFLSSRTSDCRGGLDRQRRFWREIDSLGNTDGNILFIFPDWYFGALIFSVVNAAAKRPSKFAFDRSQ